MLNISKIVVISFVTVLLGCKSRSTESQESSKKLDIFKNAYVPDEFTVDENVENGSVYLKSAIFSKSNPKAVCIPKSAEYQLSNDDKIELIGVARLQFAGHPARKMSYKDLWEKSVSAYMIGDTILISDNVTWDSNIEGGAQLILIVKIPRKFSANVFQSDSLKSFKNDSLFKNIDIDIVRDTNMEYKRLKTNDAIKYITPNGVV